MQYPPHRHATSTKPTMTKYRETPVPDNKPPEDYTYNERRAELLQFVIEAGHPDRISRKRMGQRYDVDPTTITNDIQTLADQIGPELAADAEMVTATVYRKAIREKVEDGDWMDAVDLLESWNGWLFDTGEQEKEPDKLDLEVDPGDAYMDALRAKAAQSDGDGE